MKAKKISALLLAAAMTACAVPAQGAAADEPKVPKYIFLFIGDGMSYPQVQTTNYYLNAIEDDGDDILTSESKLNMMKFPFPQAIRITVEQSIWMRRWKLLMRQLLKN